MLRKKGVVDKFVEFYGPGLDNMTVADRATIANMAPEYGATCGFFPIDQQTIDYLTMTGRDPTASRWSRPMPSAGPLAQRRYPRSRVHRYAVARHRRRRAVDGRAEAPAGSRNARHREGLFQGATDQEFHKARRGNGIGRRQPFDLGHGDVVIAAITSCTNTSNPSVLMAAGLLARNAAPKGLRQAMGQDFAGAGFAGRRGLLHEIGLQTDLDKLASIWSVSAARPASGIRVRSMKQFREAIPDNNLVAAAVLSGNRNFEGRVNPDVRANYLASPPLVVAYALAGSWHGLVREPLGRSGRQAGLPQRYLALEQGNPKLHRSHDRQRNVQVALCRRLQRRYATGSDRRTKGQTYGWDGSSTYVQNPPYFSG